MSEKCLCDEAKRVATELAKNQQENPYPLSNGQFSQLLSEGQGAQKCLCDECRHQDQEKTVLIGSRWIHIRCSDHPIIQPADAPPQCKEFEEKK